MELKPETYGDIWRIAEDLGYSKEEFDGLLAERPDTVVLRNYDTVVRVEVHPGRFPEVEYEAGDCAWTGWVGAPHPTFWQTYCALVDAVDVYYDRSLLAVFSETEEEKPEAAKRVALVTYGRAQDVEDFVAALTRRSGQFCTWGYFAGRAVIWTTGDIEAVQKADYDLRWMRIAMNMVSAGETSVAVGAYGSYKDLLRKEEP